MRRFLLFVLAAVVLAACGGDTFSPAERAYVSQVNDAVANVKIANDTLAGLLQSPQPASQEWAASYALHIAAIRVIVSEAMRTRPPSRYAQAHLDYRRAMRSFGFMADAYESRQIDRVVHWRQEGDRAVADLQQALGQAGLPPGR